MAAYIGGIGILGPGLDSWPHAAAVLSGRRAYEPKPTILPMPTLLAPTERRRTGRVVKLALAVALEATTHAGAEPGELKSVFSSSGGDGHNCHEICQSLALEAREISPTRFSNSVHNVSSNSQLVSCINANTRSNLKFPLATHNFAVSSCNLYTSS